MRISHIYTALLLVASTTITSCDDFLTQRNPNELTTQVFWERITDCDKSLIAIYNSFKDQNIYSFVDENLRSDIAIQGNKNRVNFDNQAYLQTFNDAYAVANNKWAALYKGVFRSNQLIEGLDIVREKISSESEIERWTQIKAQAHFFRGLFYFFLNNAYNKGAVPILDYVPTKPNEFFQPLSSTEEVKEFYRKDLEKSLELGLCEYWDSPKDKGRVTAASARSILGMSYLYDKEYELAKPYFQSVIDDSRYYLNEDPNHATVANEFDSESILEVAYTLDNNSELLGESNLFNMFGMSVSKCGGWVTVVPSFWLVEQFEKEPVDPMDKTNWIELHQDTIKTLPVSEYDTITYDYDIFYEQLGKRIGREYTVASDPDVIYYEDYVYRQMPSTEEYSKHLYIRTIRKDKEGNMIKDAKANPLYKQAGFLTIFEKFVPFYSEGKLYRLRSHSLRASNSLAINGDEDIAYYQKPAQSNAPFNQRETGYFKKYSNWDIWKKETDGLPVNNSGINLRLVRLSDIYLMYAECMIKGGMDDGGVSTALKYINKVRRRAKTVLVGSEEDAMAEYKGEATYQDTESSSGLYLQETPLSTAKEIMEHLMYVERPLELCLDGFSLRVIDLRRWGITHDRFKQLAQEQYTNVHTQFIKEVNGKYSTVSNWGKQNRYTTESKTPPYVDYEQASINFDESKAYWPIPSVEKISNPYIK